MWVGCSPRLLAVVQIEDQIIFLDVVGGSKAQFVGGAVDGFAGTFEFGVGADGSFVDFQQEMVGPFVAGGEFVGGAVFFVAKPAAEAEALKDFLQRGSVGDVEFGFFTDLVAALVASWRVCQWPGIRADS